MGTFGFGHVRWGRCAFAAAVLPGIVGAGWAALISLFRRMA